MKKYSKISKLGLILCLVGMILTIVNRFTGFINPKIMTNGGSVICLMGFIYAFIYIIGSEKQKSNQK